MDSFSNSLQEYIKSEKYFHDARLWYYNKYINPFFQRSVMLLIVIIVCTIAISSGLFVRSLYPLSSTVPYYITIQNQLDRKFAQVIKANNFPDDALLSITDIFIRNYVARREAYYFNNIEKQDQFVQNSSTKIVYRDYAVYMSINNVQSPVIRYKHYAKRSVDIISTKYNDDQTEVVVKFVSKAVDNNGDIIENMLWQATINYEIDKIDLNLPPNSKFNFTVTEYQVKLLEKR